MLDTPLPHADVRALARWARLERPALACRIPLLLLDVFPPLFAGQIYRPPWSQPYVGSMEELPPEELLRRPIRPSSP